MKHIFAFATATLLWFAACQPKDPYSLDCGYCPNNTQCLDGDCGCPPDQLDMGSWCMRKDSQTYVAFNMLGVPCFEPFGIRFNYTRPEQPVSGVAIPASSYSLLCRSTVFIGGSANFSYYALPGGDSIQIYAPALPTDNTPIRCQIKPGQSCLVYLSGRFTHPDSIRATLRWVGCTDVADTPSPVQFWLVRSK